MNTGLEDFKNFDDKPLFGISGYGDKRQRPKVTSDTQNRRIEVRFILRQVTPKDYIGR